MEVLDKGKHCAEEFCHQIDLLPMKCKACGNHFCAAHFKYEAHGCKEADKFNYKIPTCELCHQTIEFKRHKDLDLCLAEHLEKCQMSDHSSARSKKPGKKCSLEGCRHKRDVFCFECETCGNSFCVRHRIPEDHKCTGRSASRTLTTTCSQEYARRNPLFTKPQTSFSSFLQKLF